MYFVLAIDRGHCHGDNSIHLIAEPLSVRRRLSYLISALAKSISTAPKFEVRMLRNAFGGVSRIERRHPATS